MMPSYVKYTFGARGIQKGCSTLQIAIVSMYLERHTKSVLLIIDTLNYIV